MAYQRPPAPEELRAIESFCDAAAFLHGWDHFADVESARAWLIERGHADAARHLDEVRLARLVGVREAVRGHLDGDTAARTRLNLQAEELLGAPRWNADGGAVVPMTTSDPVLAVAAGILSTLAAAELSGRRARLKVCRSRECQWVYYDRSPANNSTWCSMDICGARHKMRAYRSRRDTD